MTKADSVIRIPTKIDTSFFRYWLIFLQPIHKLTIREIDVATAFIKYRFELSKKIKDEEILDKVVMSEDTRKSITKECGMTTTHFQVVMSKLKKNKVILDNKINPKFIPNITEDAESFKLLLLFDLK